MTYTTIPDCTITRTTSNVLYPYIDSDTDEWFKRYGGFHTGIDVQCKSVHSACQGVVIMIGEDHEDGTLEITIQYDAYQGFRYCHIERSLVQPGDIIQNGQWIADAKDFVHFEYIDVKEENSQGICHVGTMNYYKHNPLVYATGEQVLPNEDLVDVVVIEADAEFAQVVFTPEMDEEFSNNRVDDEPYGIG